MAANADALPEHLHCEEGIDAEVDVVGERGEGSGRREVGVKHGCEADRRADAERA